MTLSIDPISHPVTDRVRLRQSACLRDLVHAAATGTELGVAIVDRDSRFQAVNAKLAGECHMLSDDMLGKTTREGVGDLAAQIEPVFERAFATGKPQSLWLQGTVRNAQEAGCWYGRYFPFFDAENRVRQVAVFAVNVTAVRTTEEIIAHLLPAPRWRSARLNDLLIDFEATVIDYQMDMLRMMDKVTRQLTGAARPVDELHLAFRKLDRVVADIRDLSSSMIAELPIPSC